MSAHLCLIAWKLPIGRPNWIRVLAYSTDASRTRCAPPTCSAASATAARSSVLDRPGSAPPSVPISVAGVPENSSRACLRVWSIVGRGVRVSPGASPCTAKKGPAPRRARRHDDQVGHVPVEYEHLVAGELPPVTLLLGRA